MHFNVPTTSTLDSPVWWLVASIPKWFRIGALMTVSYSLGVRIATILLYFGYIRRPTVYRLCFSVLLRCSLLILGTVKCGFHPGLAANCWSGWLMIESFHFCVVVLRNSRVICDSTCWSLVQGFSSRYDSFNNFIWSIMSESLLYCCHVSSS